MRHARFFSILVFAITALYAAVGFHVLPLASFQGDLTRLGMLPESQFGWTKPQPAIAPALMHQSSWKEAEVLVVGDSFSDGRIWQTVLTQAGLRVRTESWDSVRGICEDFMPWLRNQGFTGKFIVLESIERNLVSDMAKSVECKDVQFHPSVYADTPRGPPAVSLDSKRKDYSGRFSIGIQAQINLLEYEHASGTPGFAGQSLANGARLARVKDGCELFSHAHCSDALFLTEDRSEDLPMSALDNIEKLNARLPGVTPIWVFVPNKSTAYLYPDKQFWDRAEQRFRAPNILRKFRQAIAAKTVDLYPANNTHVSTTGYLLLGEAVYQRLRQTQSEK